MSRKAAVAASSPAPKSSSPEPRCFGLDVPWSISDAFLLLSGVIGLPLAVYFVLALIIRLGQLPHSVRDVFFGTQPISEVISYAITVVVEIGLLRWMLRKYQISWRALGLRKFRFWKATRLIIGFYFLFIGVIFGVFALIQAFLPQINTDQTQQTGFNNAHGSLELTAGFVVIVLIAPILEELFFRGFLYPALTKRFRAVGGAIISSAIFGLLHFQANISIYTFVLGLFLCFLYYKLRSTVPGMALHMLNNLVAFLILFKII